jgi:hypothetical protein
MSVLVALIKFTSLDLIDTLSDPWPFPFPKAFPSYTLGLWGTLPNPALTFWALRVDHPTM